MTTFYTSDTHFFHRNIIRYSNRPFASVEEMNEEMVRRWNARVQPRDIVYHLGDVSFGRIEPTRNLLDRLNGIIHLCPGNHDPRELQRLDRWESVEHYREIYDSNRKVILLHYGMRVWNKSHHGSLHLYGHSHGSLPGNNQSLDVGVDCWDYRPVTLKEIMERMAGLPPYRSQDHHQPRRTENSEGQEDSGHAREG